MTELEFPTNEIIEKESVADICEKYLDDEEDYLEDCFEGWEKMRKAALKNVRWRELDQMERELTEEEEAEMYGLYEFPNNPRLAEFVKKENLQILKDPEERGMLFGTREFPADPRGLELRIKSEKGELAEDDDEYEELRLLRFNKSLRTKYTPMFRDLWERTLEDDPNVVQVSMDQMKEIEIDNSAEEDKTIWTYGLGGCTAVAIVIEDGDSRKVIQSHYSPLHHGLHGNLIRAKLELDLSEDAKASVLVVTPESYNSKGQTRVDVGVEVIKATIVQELGKNVDVNTEYYSTLERLGQKDHSCFAVKLPKEGGVEYKTWYSGGEIEMKRINAEVQQLRQNVA